MDELEKFLREPISADWVEKLNSILDKTYNRIMGEPSPRIIQGKIISSEYELGE